jgi:hypothetical protein
MKKFLAFVFACACLLGCSERTDRIEKKLESYLQEGLKFMVAETIHASGNRDGLLDEPYYRVKDFRLFEGAAAEIYSAYAEVDFFIYKDIAMHEKRKYRYDVAARHWDRYLKVLHFGKDSLP